MERYVFQKVQPDDVWLKEKGTYKIATGSGGKKTAILSCPKCGESQSLSEHTIDNNGEVNPSVVCYFKEKCDFHEWVTLANYKELINGKS